MIRKTSPAFKPVQIEPLVEMNNVKDNQFRGITVWGWKMTREEMKDKAIQLMMKRFH